MDTAELVRHAIVERLTAGKQCTVTLDVADMVGTGMSLRALAAAGHPNVETAAIFKRVGDAMVDAASGVKL